MNDPVTDGARRFVKKIFLHGEWENVVFYEVKAYGSDRHTYESWLTKNYGPPIYQGTWWLTHSMLVMRDDVYMFWRLSF